MKRLVPALRERDQLRAEVLSLRAELAPSTPALLEVPPAPAIPTPARPGLEFPSGWEDWHRRRLVAERHFIPWIERVLALEGRTVLEYGSGNGPVSAAFAPRVGRFIGVDIDEHDIGVSRKILSEAGLEPELHVSPPEEILDLTASFKGQVDVFLCAAVLEHMSVAERRALLRVARDVVRPDGIIVVFETPNRLTPWDYHTSRLPFMNQLPEDLALAYLEKSPRAEFVEGMHAARARGAATEQDAFVRWGRGMSYHELELVFEDLPRHVLASSWDPILLGERDVHREELALQRVLDDARPDLPAAFSRYWLDFILTPTPREAPATFLRPWALQTSGSAGVGFDARQRVTLSGPDATLTVELPTASTTLVVGSEDVIAPLGVHVTAGDERRAGRLEPGAAAYTELRFDVSASRFKVQLSAPGNVSLVLYEG